MLTNPMTKPQELLYLLGIERYTSRHLQLVQDFLKEEKFTETDIK